MINLTVHAASADNEPQLRQIINLFQTVFGSSYPARSVYDLNFWQSHLGTRFDSLLVCNGHQLVAHIAVARDSKVASLRQLSLFVYDPHYIEEHGIQALYPLRVVLERQAARQRWELLSLFAFHELPHAEVAACQLLGAHETAVLPEYLPTEAARLLKAPSGDNIDEVSSRGAVTIYNRTFAASGLQRSLYLPEQHREIIRRLYQPLALNRAFPRSFRGDLHLVEGVPTDARAVQQHCFKHIDVALALVHPSLVSSSERLLRNLRHATAAYLFINLHDPACPQFTNDLEQAGYQFVGITPLLRGHDRIIYARTTHTIQLEPSTFISRRGQALATYLGQQASDDLSAQSSLAAVGHRGFPSEW